MSVPITLQARNGGYAYERFPIGTLVGAYKWPAIKHGFIPGLPGTDAIQTLTIDATGGTFNLECSELINSSDVYQVTNAAYNISAANLKTAIAALDNITADDLTITGGPGDDGGTMPYVITYAAAFGSAALALPDVDGGNLTGGGATATVAATARGKPLPDPTYFAIVGSDGQVAFSGLTSAMPHVAAGLVGGQWQVTRFQTAVEID